jgi:hypothetical protein
MNNYHPYKNQARQYQERQVKPQPKPAQDSKLKDYGGFDSLLVGRDCMAELGNGKVIRGVVVATSKYFYLINANGQVIVVNKAWVVSITPVQSQNKNENAGTLVDASVVPYGGKKP